MNATQEMCPLGAEGLLEKICSVLAGVFHQC